MAFKPRRGDIFSAGHASARLLVFTPVCSSLMLQSQLARKLVVDYTHLTLILLPEQKVY